METQSIGQIIKANNLPVSAGSRNLQTSNDVEKFVAARSAEKVDNRARLREVLKLIMLKMGIRERNMPTQLEFDVLIQHIQDNYSSHTVDEVMLAWELGFKGQLPLDMKEMNCFENFSCLYFSRVMNAYRDWAADREPHTWKPPPSPVFKDEDYYNQLRENVEFFYQRLRLGYYQRDFDTSIFSEILEKDGLLLTVKRFRAIKSVSAGMLVGSEEVEEYESLETPAELVVRYRNADREFIYQYIPKQS